jgi:hypothetical protein
MSRFTVFDQQVTCPACQHEESIDLNVLGGIVRGPGIHGLELLDHSSQPCAECGYTLTADEEAALADAKLDAWEPPSADDIADMKGGW